MKYGDSLYRCKQLKRAALFKDVYYYQKTEAEFGIFGTRLVMHQQLTTVSTPVKVLGLL